MTDDHLLLWLDGEDRALLAARLLDIDGVRALGGVRPDGDDATTLRAIVVPTGRRDDAERVLAEWTGSAMAHWSGPARPAQPGSRLADRP